MKGFQNYKLLLKLKTPLDTQYFLSQRPGAMGFARKIFFGSYLNQLITQYCLQLRARQRYGSVPKAFADLSVPNMRIVNFGQKAQIKPKQLEFCTDFLLKSTIGTFLYSHFTKSLLLQYSSLEALQGLFKQKMSGRFRKQLTKLVVIVYICRI